MDTGFWIGAIIVIAILVVAWKLSPRFRSKVDKVVDRDGDGRPFK